MSYNQPKPTLKPNYVMKDGQLHVQTKKKVVPYESWKDKITRLGYPHTAPPKRIPVADSVSTPVYTPLVKPKKKAAATKRPRPSPYLTREDLNPVLEKLESITSKPKKKKVTFKKATKQQQPTQKQAEKNAPIFFDQLPEHLKHEISVGLSSMELPKRVYEEGSDDEEDITEHLHEMQVTYPPDVQVPLTTEYLRELGLQTDGVLREAQFVMDDSYLVTMPPKLANGEDVANWDYRADVLLTGRYTFPTQGMDLQPFRFNSVPRIRRIESIIKGLATSVTDAGNMEEAIAQGYNPSSNENTTLLNARYWFMSEPPDLTNGFDKYYEVNGNPPAINVLIDEDPFDNMAYLERARTQPNNIDKVILSIETKYRENFSLVAVVDGDQGVTYNVDRKQGFREGPDLEQMYRADNSADDDLGWFCPSGDLWICAHYSLTNGFLAKADKEPPTHIVDLTYRNRIASAMKMAVSLHYETTFWPQTAFDNNLLFDGKMYDQARDIGVLEWPERAISLGHDFPVTAAHARYYEHIPKMALSTFHHYDRQIRDMEDDQEVNTYLKQRDIHTRTKKKILHLAECERKPHSNHVIYKHGRKLSTSRVGFIPQLFRILVTALRVAKPISAVVNNVIQSIPVSEMDKFAIDGNIENVDPSSLDAVTRDALTNVARRMYMFRKPPFVTLGQDEAALNLIQNASTPCHLYIGKNKDSQTPGNEVLGFQATTNEHPLPGLAHGLSSDPDGVKAVRVVNGNFGTYNAQPPAQWMGTAPIFATSNYKKVRMRWVVGGGDNGLFTNLANSMPDPTTYLKNGLDILVDVQLGSEMVTYTIPTHGFYNNMLNNGVLTRGFVLGRRETNDEYYTTRCLGAGWFDVGVNLQLFTQDRALTVEVVEEPVPGDDEGLLKRLVFQRAKTIEWSSKANTSSIPVTIRFITDGTPHKKVTAYNTTDNTVTETGKWLELPPYPPLTGTWRYAQSYTCNHTLDASVMEEVQSMLVRNVSDTQYLVQQKGIYATPWADEFFSTDSFNVPIPITKPDNISAVESSEV